MDQKFKTTTSSNSGFETREEQGINGELFVVTRYRTTKSSSIKEDLEKKDFQSEHID